MSSDEAWQPGWHTFHCDKHGDYSLHLFQATVLIPECPTCAEEAEVSEEAQSQ